MDYPQQFKGEPKAARFRDISLKRLDQMEGGSYGSLNLTSVLFQDRADSDQVLTLEVYHCPGTTKVPFDEALRAKYEPLKKGDQFGPSWSNHWVRLNVKVPNDWQKYERVQIEFDPSCEAMFFNTEGLPLQGITGGGGGDRRVEFILNGKARQLPTTFYIEVSCNGMFGLDQMEGDAGFKDRYFALNSADLVAPRMEAWHLLWDFRVLRDLAKVMPDSSALQHQAMGTANAICNTFDHTDLSSIGRCRKLAEHIFGQGWSEKGADVYKDLGATSLHPQCYAVSNCHIDTAWLWPFSATQQKVARSWSTQIDLMDRYPEHRFAASQAQQYKWLEQLYPQLFDKVKSRVASGEFQPIGGCWVEMDTNMPSGESICRQFLFGQRYFKSRFNKLCETFFLPDTFGYSSQLPQLARLAGMNHFFTQKLSWSQFNNFPATTFNWVGLDGSQVLCHMPPVNTYTAQATVNDVKVTVTDHKNLEQTDLGILPYGNGDGGGGALAPMDESLRRIRAASNTWSDICKVDVGSSFEDFFHKVRDTTNAGKDLVTWSGELYLEYHRGTYTSHANIKHYNRRAEVLLHDLEWTATQASLLGAKNEHGNPYKYPHDEINALWEDVLLCQFHDVLPGSALEMVYRDAERIHRRVAVQGHALLHRALQALHAGSSPDFSAKQALGQVFAVNTLSVPRRELVRVSNINPSSFFTQKVKGSEDHLVLFETQPGGHVALPVMRPQLHGTKSDMGVKAITSHEGGAILDNGRLRVTFSPQGRITSLFDLVHDREVLDQTFTAGYVMYQDWPTNFEAWDIDIFHTETPTHLEGQILSIEEGVLRSTVHLQFKYEQTTIKAHVSLDALTHDSLHHEDSLSLLRVANHIDFRTQRVILKFELPLAIRAESAIYDTQFGVVTRPTHRNTTWDAAKFEVCGHKFADLSEYGYGVALLNQNKYGYSVANNIMRLSLLKGARYPDRHQDQGEHFFEFAILPHKGHFVESQVVNIARAYNSPMHLMHSKEAQLAVQQDLLMVNHGEMSPNLIVDTIKRGEEDDFNFGQEKTAIVRVFDAFGGAGKVTWHIDVPIVKASLVDLLERDIEPLEQLKDLSKPDRTTISFKMRAFEVKTIKFTLTTADAAAASSQPQDQAEPWVAL